MTSVTTDTARENSGALQNNFDKDKVQSEINLQMDVTKNFDANRQEAGITVDNIVKALEVTGQAIEGAKQTLAIAKQAQQEIQKLSPEDQVIFENFLTELAQSQKADRKDSYYPLVLAAGEGLAMAAAACARSPACASATVNVLGAVGVAILNEQSDDKSKKNTPKPLPSTSGNSATGMPPNNDDENGKKSIEKTSHAQLRSEQGRPVGQAINDIQKARNSDIMVQSRDGSYIVRGVNGREHIVSQEGKLITSIANRSSQANRNLLQSGQRRPASQAEIDRIKSFVK